MTIKEKIRKIRDIRDALVDLWSDVPERKGVCFVQPHPNPDFNTIQECMDGLAWENIDPMHNLRVENIREAIKALRDEVTLSEQTISFDPLKGFGFKYDQSSGVVKFHRYKQAQELIDMAGSELHRLLVHLNHEMSNA